MKSVNPYLIFNGEAQEAFDFYQSVFGGDVMSVRFADMPGMEDLSDEDQNRLAHVSLHLGSDGQVLMASDATSTREVDQSANASFYVNLEPESAEEAERVFTELSDGGRVIMPLEKSDWAELFAMFTDRFGIQWMINYE